MINRAQKPKRMAGAATLALAAGSAGLALALWLPIASSPGSQLALLAALVVVVGSAAALVASQGRTTAKSRAPSGFNDDQAMSGDGAPSPTAMMRRRASVVPSTVPTTFDQPVAAGSTSSKSSKTETEPTVMDAAPARSTLRVTEIGVREPPVDDAGTTAGADPIPSLIDVPLNCLLAPHEFENEYVRGKLLFMVDSNDGSVPEPPDARKMFEGRRRLFWVQVQLQFKQEPSGIVYIGGEVPRPMSLGFFTGGMTKIILSVLQSLVPGLHYSFGQKRNDGTQGTSRRSKDSESFSDNEDEELPHICFPLYTAVDQFVATPPGETPPTLGSEDFGEPKEKSLQRRRSGQLFYPFNTRDTYSFHFHSFFIDFAHWQVVNLPGLRNTDLRVFWDNMPLRIVCYSLNNTRTNSDTVQRFRGARNLARRANVGGGTSAAADDAKRAVHSWAVKEYKFCLELKPQDPNAVQMFNSTSGARQLQPVAADPAVAFATPQDAGLVSDAELILKRLEDLQKELARFEIRVPAWFEYFSHSRTHSERRVGYVMAVRTFSCESDESSSNDSDSDSDDDERRSTKKKPRKVTGEYLLLHTALTAFTPLSFVEQKLSVSGLDQNLSSSGDETTTSVDQPPKSARSNSGNNSSISQSVGPLSGGSRTFYNNRSRSIEDSISVRARSLRYNKIDDERQFLEHQLQLLATVGVESCVVILPEQLCAAKSALLELLQSRQSPSELEIEWPFLSVHCAISSSDVFTRGNKDTTVKSGYDGRDTENDIDPASLSRPASPPKGGRNSQSVQVLRVVGTTQWRNEWMTLQNAGHTLRFFRTMSSSCKLSISMHQVLTISMDPPTFSSCWCRSHHRDSGSTIVEESGGTSLYWLHLGLVEKCHHIAFASPEDQEKWHEILVGCMVSSSPSSPNGMPRMAATPTLPRPQPMLDMLLKPSIMRSTSKLHLDEFATDVCIGSNVSGNGKARFSKRFVLNERCLVRMRGGCSCILSESSRGDFDAEPDAGNLVRRCLRHAIKLQSIRLDNFSTTELLTFQDSVCALRWVNLSSLLRYDEYDAESERKAFFLNLFHLMMVHASVLGLLPKSKAKWSKFFNGTTYNVGGLYFSLAEIEHGILRAPMSSLRLPIAVLVIPKLGDPDSDSRALLRLERPDFRLNFAMNCMTRSCWTSVVLYNRLTINEQLDRMTSETVARSLLYDRANRVVQLPKVCDWYRDDFVIASEGQVARSLLDIAVAAAEPVPRSIATNHAVLGLLLRFVRGPERQFLEYAWQYPSGLIDKYTFEKYDYRFQDALMEAPST